MTLASSILMVMSIENRYREMIHREPEILYYNSNTGSTCGVKSHRPEAEYIRKDVVDKRMSELRQEYEILIQRLSTFVT